VLAVSASSILRSFDVGLAGMSSSSVTLTPLRQGSAKNKKRRPNFRPTSQAKAKASSSAASTTSPAPALEDSTVSTPENQTQSRQLAKETKDDTLETQEPTEDAEIRSPSEAEKNDETVVPSTTTTTKPKTKRGRKRKKTGVAVGPSRPAPKAGETLPETAAESSALPDSGEPRLSTFCSKFRTKRKKKDKTTNLTPQEAALPDEETSTQQAAGPMVKVVNGEIVLQESSIEVTGGSSKPDEEYPVVEEEAQLAVVGASYNSFVNRRAPQHWTVEETQLFYEALRQVGTDFGTMEVYFGKKRTRKQLKRKYQMELTKCPQLVEAALDPTAKKEIGKSGCVSLHSFIS